MNRIAIFVAQLLVLLIILSLIFSNPFIISLDINDYKYSFSSNVFAGTLIIILFLFFLFFYLFFKSKFSISKYFIKNKYKKIEKGYFYFVEAMIALANKDNRNATILYKKMNSYLKNEKSLSLLLKSEVYKIEKKLPELTQVYEEMIKSKKTESLGYRGLMEQNLNSQDYHHAYIYGEKLFSLNPQIDKLYETLIYIAAKTKNWNQLIVISDKAYAKKIINKDILLENKSVGFYEIAKVKSKADLKEAIKNITKAIDMKKYFPPYLDFHLQLVSETKNILLLKKLIKKYWSLNPIPAVRLILIKIIINNKIDNMDFIYQIIKYNKQDDESKKLLIYFAIKNKKWKVARESIKGLIGANPNREICLFMADIELGENNDKQKSDSWILRSEASINQNIWICNITNTSQEEWSSLSDSGYFNSLVLSNSKMIDSSIK